MSKPERTVIPERTPEQTAIIALQSLLEARENYISRLEVCHGPASDMHLCAKSAKPRTSALQAEARKINSSNERRHAALESSCYAKIDVLRQSHEKQLATERVRPSLAASSIP